MAVNKFTLDDLLRVEGEVEWAGITFYLRTIGARHDDERQQKSLAASRKEKALLLEEGSDQREAYIVPLHSAPREELERLAEMSYRAQLFSIAIDKVHDEPEIRTKEGAGLAEVVEDDEKKEAVELETLKRRREFIEEQIIDWRKMNLEGYTDPNDEFIEAELKEDEALLEFVVNATLDNEMKKAYSLEWNRVTLACSVFKDEKHKKPFFKDEDVVMEGNPSLIDILADAYTEIDRFSRDPGELKNLLNGH